MSDNQPHVDLDDRIESSGCSDSYKILEDCISENDRDWRKCQTQVLQFRKCMVDHGRAVDSIIKKS